MTDETTVVDSATDDDLAHEGDISDATPKGRIWNRTPTVTPRRSRGPTSSSSAARTPSIGNVRGG